MDGDRSGLTVAGVVMEELRNLLEARNRHISKALSIAHGKPLHIVRGEMQYLHASDGTKYLDLVNNVSHVGHCNPHVVEAGQRQMAVLNTNSSTCTRSLLSIWADYPLPCPSPWLSDSW